MTSMSSETTTRAQDASRGEELSLNPPSEAERLVYLGRLAEKLTEWQHFVFNTAHKSTSNRVGVANVAHEIQVSAYELRIMMGLAEIDAKLGAGMTLSQAEQAQVDVKLDEARRKESVRRSTEHLRG